jgi:peptide-methionine (S)-S-oxide reductase
MSQSLDARFREAVAALDAGDAAAVQALLERDPGLSGERLREAGAWLRDRVGGALDGFFRDPYLLWFIAEDPVRNGRLPATAPCVARTLIDAIERHFPETLREQLDYALSLVCWSWIARESGVQIGLIDVLVDAGAAMGGNPENALVNGNVAAAAHLLDRGAPPTLASTAVLGRWPDAEALLSGASDEDRQHALTLAALRGRADAVRWLLAHGAHPSRPSTSLYAHATPLHHAVSSGDFAAVRVLVEAGADLDARDADWSATPLGWAEQSRGEDERGRRYAAIADYLAGA